MFTELHPFSKTASSQIAWVKLYRHYINNYSKSMATLTATKEKYPMFKTFLVQLDYTAAFFGLNLQGLLITPVQRLPRYVLLLRDLLKNTPASHPDEEPLRQALKEMQELADYVNSRKQEADNAADLAKLQAKFSGYTGAPLELNPRCKFVQNGDAKVDKKDRHLWLFTTHIIVTRPLHKDKYSFVRSFALNTSSLQQAPSDAHRRHVRLLCDAAHTIEFVSVPERERWEGVLDKVIADEHRNFMKSAFDDSHCETYDSDVSKTVLALNEKKRLAVLQKIVQTQQEFVDSMMLTITTFVEPMKKSLSSQSPMLRQKICEQICSNVEAVHQAHNTLLERLREREGTWDAHHTITDIFEGLPQLAAVMTYYFACHNAQLVALDSSLASCPIFSLWVRDTEVKSKVDFVSLLARPMKRVPELYLLCEEMLHCTARRHSSDYDALGKLVASLRDLTESFAQQKESRPSLAPPSGTRARSRSLWN
eukprot:TRINITY_DN1282_c1_g1_i14.p1 TRINITY_DN1282_c1_g1~~TRINITY_DN1282_c1_g1_i14.p1  ORF type:complete len:480 (-),score=135.88 TRINITY_DN1282_c1_g1_i14:2355-3794(-)